MPKLDATKVTSPLFSTPRIEPIELGISLGAWSCSFDQESVIFFLPFAYRGIHNVLSTIQSLTAIGKTAPRADESKRGRFLRPDMVRAIGETTGPRAL
jgi:hypothetical protein